MSALPNPNCLNCGAPLEKAFCGDCGQSANTHRMSFKHFVMHDVVHGIWHLDKGFVYTLKQLFTRPGKAAREYLAGKRVSYFNLLTLLSLLAAVYLFVLSRLPTEIVIEGRRDSAFIELLVRYSKWLLIASVFLFSLSSFLVFRRAKLNYTEHLILNGFLLGGLLVIQTLETLTYYINADTTELTVVLTIAYISWGYWGAFRGEYTLGGWLWRLLVHFILTAVLVVGIVKGCAELYYIWHHPKP